MTYKNKSLLAKCYLNLSDELSYFDTMMQKSDAVRFLFLSRRKTLMLGSCVLVSASFMVNMKQKLCIFKKLITETISAF